MAYDIIPGVDENNLFPQPVLKALNDHFRDGDNRMQLPVLTGSLNDIRRSGVYPIASDSVTDRPVESFGTLDVSQPTGGRTIQSFTTTETRPRTFTRLLYQSTWFAWVRTDVSALTKGLQPRGTDLNLLTEDGTYGIAAISGDVNSNFLNTPVNIPGTLEVSRVNAAVVQTYTTLSGDSTNITKVFVRRINASQNFIGPWTQTDSQGIDAGKLIVRKKMLLDNLSARKGGTIGLNGKGAVALRFDDAHEDFESKVLPLLRKYGLPFTRVTTSESFSGVPLPTGVFDRMQNYCVELGGEVWNHGADHNDLNGYPDVQLKIIKPLNDLNVAMPKLYIDCFSPPGNNYKWNGHFPVTSIEAFSDNYTGQTIYGMHAITSGYLEGGFYRPLDGIPRDGLRPFSWDVIDLAYLKSITNKNIAEGTGSVFMCHANQISAELLEQSMAYIAQKREEGVLEVLTVSGMSFADVSKPYRRNMLRNGNTSGSKFNESFGEIRRRMDLAGSTMCLSFSAAPGNYTLSIDGVARTLSSTTGKYRTCFTIPKDGNTLSIISTTAYTNAEMYFV